MNKLLSTAVIAFAATLATGTAHAAIIADNVAYTAQPAGPFVPLPDGRFSGGDFVAGTTGNHAQPAGSAGTYWAVGPSDGTPGYIDVTGLNALSFLWGSVDTYNSIQFLGAGDALLSTISGIMVGPPANGDQGDASTNRYVTLNLQDASIAGVEKLKFISDTNAFETTNYLFTAVPEPSTWAMMILGIGAVGFSMRRGRQKVSVRYA